MNREGKSLTQIKKEDYEKLKELIGKDKADKIFIGDEDFEDDTKYPIKEIALTILFASIKRSVKENPLLFLIILVLILLLLGMAYHEITYFW